MKFFRMYFKNNFKLNNIQRKGIIFIFGIIILIQFILLYKGNILTKKITYLIPEKLQRSYDSLRILTIKKQNNKIYPFNPNYINDSKGYFLGLSIEEIDRIIAFRKKGNYFQSKQQFKDVSGISDSLFITIEPYIKIYGKQNYNNYIHKKKYTSKNINLATQFDLQNINGIGKILSARIIKYRNSIGGFSSKEQLSKVYGLEKDVIKRIWKVFYLSKIDRKNKIIIKKDINKATIIDLKEIPGIGDKLSQKIIRYRNKLNGFSITEQLNEIYGLKPETIKLLWKHFELKTPKQITNKININDVNIKELAKHPYIDYKLSKKIISYRTVHGKFLSPQDLLKVPGFPENKLKLISLYLKFN